MSPAQGGSGPSGSGPRTVHMVAICGMGMGSLASLLLRSGHTVRGSDSGIYPPMSHQLERLGIRVNEGYDPGHVAPDTDLVIVGNAVSRGHVEVEEARARGLPCLAMADALTELFLTRRAPLVVTGTHGKTTLSFLLSHILTVGNRDPGRFIGGLLQDGGEGARLGTGHEFVVEGDEYDNVFWDKTPKFLHYRPASGVITSIEFDHADIYQSVEEIESRFAEFAALIPPEGTLVTGDGCPRLRRVARQARCRVETAGTTSEATWHTADLEEGAGGCSFEVMHGSRSLGRCHLPLPGRHNAVNAVGAIALAVSRGLEASAALESLGSFPGVRRRQEVRGVVDGVTVIDDFAHHPTAVRETLMALAQAHRERRGALWAVFEPRTATSCRRHFQEDYARAFGAADRVVIAPNARASRLAPEQRLDPAEVARQLRIRGQQALHLSSVEEILELLTRTLRSGDVVVILSNGGFGGLHEGLLEALASRPLTRAGRATA